MLGKRWRIDLDDPRGREILELPQLVVMDSVVYIRGKVGGNELWKICDET
jgi:hypothetical protein